MVSSTRIAGLTFVRRAILTAGMSSMRGFPEESENGSHRTVPRANHGLFQNPSSDANCCVSPEWVAHRLMPQGALQSPGVSTACSGSRVRGKACGSPDQIADFFISGLRKVPIPLAYPPKGLRSNGANHFIDFRLELGAGGGRAHWHGNDDLCRLFISKRKRGGAHRGTRGQTVVNQNHGTPTHI